MVDSARGKAQPGDMDSLLKFEDAIPVSGPNLEAHKADLILRAFHSTKQGKGKTQPSASISPRSKRRSKPGVDPESYLDLRTLLHAMLPPKTTTTTESPQQSGAKGMDVMQWVQFVSPKPASREDALQLAEELRRQLEDKQARKHGVCPVKEKIISGCFDELLREVAVDCPERGLLLMRIRDELRMTLAAYRTIYERSISFGASKAAISMLSVKDLAKQVEELEKEVSGLQVQALEWENRVGKTRERLERQEKLSREERSTEVSALKTQIESLQTFLGK